jgi:hypothetical protein
MNAYGGLGLRGKAWKAGVLASLLRFPKNLIRNSRIFAP